MPNVVPVWVKVTGTKPGVRKPETERLWAELCLEHSEVPGGRWKDSTREKLPHEVRTPALPVGDPRFLQIDDL